MNVYQILKLGAGNSDMGTGLAIVDMEHWQVYFVAFR